MQQFKPVVPPRSRSVVALGLVAALAWLLTAALARAQSTLTRDNLSPSNAQVAATLSAYQQARGARFVDWLADGSLLIATRLADSPQIHRVRTPLGMREQVSFVAGGVSAAAARPYASDALVYLQRARGDELGQLFLQSLTSPQPPVALTDAGHSDGAALWAHDGKRLVFTSNRSNSGEVDVYLLDTRTPGSTPRLLVGGNGAHWRIFDWSVDDKRLLLGREGAEASTAAPDCEVFLADVDSGELSPVSLEQPKPTSGKRSAEHSPPIVNAVHARAARFATDGHGLLLLTRTSAGNGSSQFLHLSYTDPSGREWRELGVESPHDVELFDQSIDGRYLAYTLNDNGISRLVLVDQQRKLDLNIGELPAGVIRTLKFDSSGKRLALSLESVLAPSDVYVFEPEGHVLTRWTQSEVGPLDVRSFVTPEPLRFPTWDRLDTQPRELSALLYHALGTAAPASGRPVLIMLRGAGAQSRPDFEPFEQYLVHQFGLVILDPNMRGATGYGAALEQLGSGALREDATRDVGSLLAWIGLQHELDRNRVVLLGEGDGAYLALQSLAAYPDRLLGGIAAFPPHLSALSNITSIRHPLLLVQGLNNFATPAYELEQLRSRLRVNGDAVSYLAASEEANRFTRKTNRDAYWAATADFLAQLLR